MPARRKRDPYLVFISYSHRDRWIARHWVRLIGEIGRGRIRTFLDEKDIDGGSSIAETIRDSIRKCDELLVLVTPASKSRQWVIVEMSVAWGLKKRVVAVLHHAAPKDMPEVIYPYKAFDLNEFDTYLQQLEARARERLK
jgi:hypothetical protein